MFSRRHRGARAVSVAYSRSAALLSRVHGCLMKPEIVIGELRIGFGGDSFAGGRRVVRQREIFLVQLLRVAAELHIGTVRFVGRVPVRHIRLGVAVSTAATSAATLCILRLSH